VEKDAAIPGESGAADRRRAAHREDELVLGVGVELILGADHQIVEAREPALVFATSRIRNVSVKNTDQSLVTSLL